MLTNFSQTLKCENVCDTSVSVLGERHSMANSIATESSEQRRCEEIEAWNTGHVILVLATSLLVCASPHRQDRQKCLLFAPLRAANSNSFVFVTQLGYLTVFAT